MQFVRELLMGEDIATNPLYSEDKQTEVLQAALDAGLGCCVALKLIGAKIFITEICDNKRECKLISR